jgi:UDP-N-acetylmuramoyl-L-alanyl-D-glutamate--2,6-diaminopimelate ligase
MERTMRLSRLLEGAGVRPLAPVGSDPEITGVGLDSRSLRDGEMFFALKGQSADGVSFVSQAVARGARAVLAGSPRSGAAPAAVAWVQVAEPRRAAGRLAREWFGRPDETLTLVGVTGTNGKTTVTYLVEAIAKAAGRAAGRIGTIGAAFGGTEQAASRTTPEATDLYALLARMRDAGTEVVVMEVSSHALALGRVEGARIRVAAFLNLGSDHLDFHGDVETYFEAKARLFDELDPGATAVLPADDPRGAALARRTRARTLTFGRTGGADVRIASEAGGPDGSSVVLETPAGTIIARTSLLGKLNVDNVAAAAACGIALGCTPGAISGGIGSLRGVPGRLEPVDSGQPFTVLVDYAHTEAALSRMLSSVRELTGGRVLVTFGCGGERDREKRPAMGRAAVRLADRVFLTSDNPRGEDPVRILGEIAAGADSVPGGAARYEIVPDRSLAIETAIRAAGPGDVVVIAGKGHETAQVLAERTVPIDDRDVARKALASLGWIGRKGAHAQGE